MINALRTTVGDSYVLVEKEDGSIFQLMAEIVVLPANVEEVVAVIKVAKRADVPIVPRGSGTGLAGRKIA